MTVRAFTIASLSGALLLAVSPALAQGVRSVMYQGTGFEFEGSLGRSVNIALVHATPGDEFQPGDPAHISFTLYGARDEGQRSPRIGWSPVSAREVRVYQVAALADNEASAGQLEALQRLLTERPDVTTLSTATDVEPVRLPWMPPIAEAARIVQVRPQYIDTPEVSGISYVASYAQDIIPPTSNQLLWTFQGLSVDGARYVSAIWTLRTDVLPAELPEDLFDRIDREWPTILAATSTTIEDAAPDAFTPDLDALDSLVRTLVLPGGAASQTPEASPGP